MIKVHIKFRNAPVIEKHFDMLWAAEVFCREQLRFGAQSAEIVS